VIPPLLKQYLTGAVVDSVTRCQCQGRLLGEARRDLEALKKARYKAERDMENLEERFERELQAANYEIRQLKVRHITPHTQCEVSIGCPTGPVVFVHGRAVTPKLMPLPFDQAILVRERRVVYQPTAVTTGQHAIVREGTKTA